MITGKYYIHEGNMGCNATRGDAENYAEYLRGRIASEYPDNDVAIVVGEGPDYIDTDDYEEKELFTNFVSDCWGEWLDMGGSHE